MIGTRFITVATTNEVFSVADTRLNTYCDTNFEEVYSLGEFSTTDQTNIVFAPSTKQITFDFGAMQPALVDHWTVQTQ